MRLKDPFIPHAQNTETTKNCQGEMAHRQMSTTTSSFCLALAIPDLIVAGKVLALGGVDAAPRYGVKKALEAATNKRYDASAVEKAARAKRKRKFIRHPDGSTHAWKC